MSPVPVLLESKLTNFASSQTVPSKYSFYRHFRVTTAYHTINLLNKAFYSTQLKSKLQLSMFELSGLNLHEFILYFLNKFLFFLKNKFIFKLNSLF